MDFWYEKGEKWVGLQKLSTVIMTPDALFVDDAIKDIKRKLSK